MHYSALHRSQLSALTLVAAMAVLATACGSDTQNLAPPVAATVSAGAGSDAPLAATADRESASWDLAPRPAIDGDDLHRPF